MATKREEHLPSLVLLPAPPEPANALSLGEAYRTALDVALAKTRVEHQATTLIVAIAAPFLSGPSQYAQALSWQEAQSLLAGIYTIIAVLCAKQAISTEADGGAGSVDARVVLLQHDGSQTPTDKLAVVEPNNTVVLDTPSFAAAYYQWKQVFYVDNEMGVHLRDVYLRLARTVHPSAGSQLVAVPGGPAPRGGGGDGDNGSGSGSPASTMHLPTPGYRTVCLGGTFDHLHPGHKLLLSAGALLLDAPMPLSGQACQYIIGITGDAMLANKKYGAYVQPWSDRARGVIRFLASLLALAPDDGEPVDERDGDFRASFRSGAIEVQCVCIMDAFGPTIERQDIDCLVVSAETHAGGQKVNEERARKKWHRLDVFEVDVLSADEASATATAASFDAKISSTAIRRQRAERAAAAEATQQ